MIKDHAESKRVHSKISMTYSTMQTFQTTVVFQVYKSFKDTHIHFSVTQDTVNMTANAYKKQPP